MRRKALLLFGTVLLGVPSRSAHGAITDPRFIETLWLDTKLKAITSMAWAPDDSNRLFLLQKSGHIQIVKDRQLLAAPFASVAPITVTGECGLLGLAFDPAFLENQYLYVFVTVSPTEQQVIRYTVEGDLGVDKTVIVSGLPTLGLQHDGGALGFGADGKLYWAIGDNGDARSGVDEDLTTLAAKLGRANPDGSAPADNPFNDGDGPNNDYIWARGFRNPFTLALQPSTGRIWLNVVGAGLEQVFTPTAGDNGGWDDFESNQPAGYLTPIVSYFSRTPPKVLVATAGAVRQDGVATITTTIPHRLRPGARVTLAGVTDPSFNGSGIISESEGKTFSFPQAGADAASGLGTASGDALGGAITGGEFWDASSAPEDHRGDYFFGDFNSGNLMRVLLDDDSRVLAVEPWGSGIKRAIDMAVGPDGDLYYAGHAGAIYRASHAAAEQAIIVARLNLRVLEGASAAFGVRLAVQPNEEQVVDVSFSSGDEDVSVVSGAVLRFGPADWSSPQMVVVSAVDDADISDDAAQLSLSAPALADQLVQVRVTDDDDVAAGAGGAAGRGTGGRGDDETGAPARAGGAGAGEAGAGLAGLTAGEGGERAGFPGAAVEADGCGCRTAPTGHAHTVVVALAALLMPWRRLTRRKPVGQRFDSTSRRSDGHHR